MIPDVYILDNYGHCVKDAKGRCTCRTSSEWRGCLCPYWVPIGASSLEDLRIIAESKRKC